jgi:DNA-binding NtrC family response regulator
MDTIKESETQSQKSSVSRFGQLIGSAPAMAEVFALADRVAPCDVTALITGETGTGKELLAHAMHDRSQRSSGPFVAFSCANLPDTLIDDELFGHERGAFTGAEALRRGRFETANGGTLFLDEIGDLPLALQSRLLRVLQDRSFERLGGSGTVSVDFRLICATHRDLEAMVGEGTFREDLFYRLNVVQLRMPPLRDRRDDIDLLAKSFLEWFASKFSKDVTGFSAAALNALAEYDWPGNVRELENVVQRAVVLAETSTVELTDLPAEVSGAVHCRLETEGHYDTEVREFKRRLIMRMLRVCGGNKSEAARSLHMARPYLHRLIASLEVDGVALEAREQERLSAA